MVPRNRSLSLSSSSSSGLRMASLCWSISSTYTRTDRTVAANSNLVLGTRPAPCGHTCFNFFQFLCFVFLPFFVLLVFLFFRVYLQYHGYVPGVLWLQVIRDGMGQLVSMVSLADWYGMMLPCAPFRTRPFSLPWGAFFLFLSQPVQ